MHYNKYVQYQSQNVCSENQLAPEMWTEI